MTSLNDSELKRETVPENGEKQDMNDICRTHSDEKTGSLQIGKDKYILNTGNNPAFQGSKLKVGSVEASSDKTQSKPAQSNSTVQNCFEGDEYEYVDIVCLSIEIKASEQYDYESNKKSMENTHAVNFHHDFSGKDIVIQMSQTYTENATAYEIETKVLLGKVNQVYTVTRGPQDFQDLADKIAKTPKCIVPRLLNEKKSTSEFELSDLETLKRLVFLKKCILDPELRERDEIFDFLTNQKEPIKTAKKEAPPSKIWPFKNIFTGLFDVKKIPHRCSKNADFPKELLDSELKFKTILYPKMERFSQNIMMFLSKDKNLNIEALMTEIKKDWEEEFEKLGLGLASLQKILVHSGQNKDAELQLLVKIQSVLSDIQAVCTSFSSIREKKFEDMEENQKIIVEFGNEMNIYEKRINEELSNLF